MYLYSTTEIKKIVQKQNPNVDKDIISEELRNTNYYGKHGFKKAYFSSETLYLNFLDQDMMNVISSFIENEKQWAFDPAKIKKYKYNKAVMVECNDENEYQEKAKKHKVILRDYMKKMKISKQKNLEVKETGDFKRIKETDKILSIDFEYQRTNIDYVSEMGITIFHNGIIESFHYVINKFAGNPAYGKGLSQRSFKFGETLFVDKDEMIELLTNHMDGMNFMLGKSVEVERQIINIAGFGIKKKKSIELDECHRNFNPESKKILKLKEMAAHYGIEGGNFHNAGNDAYYTMQIFLKMKEMIK